MRVQSLSQKDLLEDDMATYSNILVWKTPWTEEPGRFQSKGSQRAGHDSAIEPPCAGGGRTSVLGLELDFLRRQLDMVLLEQTVFLFN